MSFVLVASSLAAFYFVLSPERESVGNPPGSPSSAFVPLSPPSRGGPFSLVDHTGRAVTDEDFRGRFMLVFFGYTFCPDVCPTELQTMAEVIDLLGVAGGEVRPVFITVDPERDTVEAMAGYVAAFHPRLIGLTGTPERIAAAAKAFHAGYMRVPLPSAEGGKEGDQDGDADYGMAHSATTYLVGPDGRVLATYPRGLPPAEMAADIRRFIDNLS